MENVTDSPSVQFEDSMTITSPLGGFDVSRSEIGVADAIDGSPLTPRRKRAGRIMADNTDETKARHAALYTYYKTNPGFSQSKLAQWFTDTYSTTMSQCSVSREYSHSKSEVLSKRLLVGSLKTLKVHTLIRDFTEILKKQKLAHGEVVEDPKPRQYTFLMQW